MRSALTLFLVTLLLAFGVGCFSGGPYYEPVSGFPDGAGGYKLVVSRVWTASGPGIPPTPSKRELFVADARSDGDEIRIQPGTAIRLGMVSGLGGIGTIEARPIDGTNTWLVVARDSGLGGHKLFTVVDVARDCTVRSRRIRDEIDHDDTIAAAVSLSGPSVLLVDSNSAKLWDATTGNERRVEDADDLVKIRGVLLTQRRSVGRWWMTDDCRYVVVVPDKEIRHRGAWLSSRTPMWVEIAGVKVDIQNHAIVYDRTARTISIVANGGYDRVLRFKIVNGELRFQGDSDVVPFDRSGSSDLVHLGPSSDDRRERLDISSSGLSTWESGEAPSTFLITTIGGRPNGRRTYRLSPDSVKRAIDRE
jgi:hypothetical protein